MWFRWHNVIAREIHKHFAEWSSKRLGNPRGNENPFLLTFGVMWFRWHNVIARELRKQHAEWSSKRLGNPRGNENPFLLTFGVMWFRWHNVIARELRKQHAEWSSERVFNEARKWVIATHQKIVIYDWLPRWLGTELDGYT
ncbi:hypothetical protein B566_EDAN013267, partial [Ephemera danica]